LNGRVPAEKASIRISPTGLDVLPAGKPPANPAELLETKGMHDLVAWARAHYDW